MVEVVALAAARKVTIRNNSKMPGTPRRVMQYSAFAAKENFHILSIDVAGVVPKSRGL